MYGKIVFLWGNLELNGRRIFELKKKLKSIMLYFIIVQGKGRKFVWDCRFSEYYYGVVKLKAQRTFAKNLYKQVNNQIKNLWSAKKIKMSVVRMAQFWTEEYSVTQMVAGAGAGTGYSTIKPFKHRKKSVKLHFICRTINEKVVSLAIDNLMLGNIKLTKRYFFTWKFLFN